MFSFWSLKIYKNLENVLLKNDGYKIMKFADEIGFDFVNFTKDKKVEFFNVNDKDDFANALAEVDETFEIPLNPSAATSTTALTLQYDNAVFLNGAKLDLLPAACYGVGNALPTP